MTTDPTNGQSTVVRTSRGWSIAGTRISLYSILDYLHADWSPKLIQEWFGLKDAQMADVLVFLATHHDEIEQDYKQIVQQADESRRYWEEQNRDRVAHSRPRRNPPIKPPCERNYRHGRKRSLKVNHRSRRPQRRRSSALAVGSAGRRRLAGAGSASLCPVHRCRSAR